MGRELEIFALVFLCALAMFGLAYSIDMIW